MDAPPYLCNSFIYSGKILSLYITLKLNLTQKPINKNNPINFCETKLDKKKLSIKKKIETNENNK
jgi:hypothetical protein